MTKYSCEMLITILMIVAAFLGFLASWLLRQDRINKITALANNHHKEKLEKEDRLQELMTLSEIQENEKKQLYSEKTAIQVKYDKMTQNFRENQQEIDLLHEKIKNLTEISIIAQEEVLSLKNELDNQQVYTDTTEKVLVPEEHPEQQPSVPQPTTRIPINQPKPLTLLGDRSKKG